MICSPAQTHAEVTLAALDQGLHVFVEKPMCITLADADRIVEARERTGKVVQVGYMKRFDRAWERMLGNLPESAESLRYIRVMVHDPEFVPFFAPGEIVRGSDIPPDVLEEGREQMRAQVKAAVGDNSPAVITAFEGAFLGSLVHDVNVVHGLLERLGEPLPAEVLDGDWWNEGQAVTGAVRLANGARWDSAWIQLLDVYEYRESVAFYLRRRGAHAQLSVTLAQAVADALRGLACAGRRASRRVVRVVRGELRPRACALPRLRRERDRVPHPTGAGPSGHGRTDGDVLESGLPRLSGPQPLSR